MNGKKSRFRNDDWTVFAQYLGLTDQQQRNVHQRFRSRLNLVSDWIKSSFLSADSQQAYQHLITERAGRLNWLE